MMRTLQNKKLQNMGSGQNHISCPWSSLAVIVGIGRLELLDPGITSGCWDVPVSMKGFEVLETILVSN